MFQSHFFFKPILQCIQWYDRSTVKRVDLFIANSSMSQNVSVGVIDERLRCYHLRSI